MKIKGHVTMLINREYTTIEFRDINASFTFASVQLTPNQLSAMLSRQAYIPCAMEVKGLDKVGKKMEHQQFEFELPSEYRDYGRDLGGLRLFAQDLLDLKQEGWICDGGFASQNTFFEKDGVRYARETVRRWV